MNRDEGNPIMPWLASNVECLECGKTWVAVRELGTTLECPDCGSREIDPDAIQQ